MRRLSAAWMGKKKKMLFIPLPLSQYFWTVLSEPGVLQCWYCTTGSTLVTRKLWIWSLNPFPVSWVFLKSFWMLVFAALPKVYFSFKLSCESFCTALRNGQITYSFKIILIQIYIIYIKILACVSVNRYIIVFNLGQNHQTVWMKFKFLCNSSLSNT